MKWKDGGRGAEGRRNKKGNKGGGEQKKIEQNREGGGGSGRIRVEKLDQRNRAREG